ncbi:putative C6 transcription factor [Paraphoma chrysanthemicola]|uniref:C6 transcription factor n=1 Tax=Paraphoma chrysanthemicola TaxID=798071 RepID=A0A8K0W4V7_9PLEO|nr:putative C6 transcription factor [Paraphoma chrysanthemicola]
MAETDKSEGKRSKPARPRTRHGCLNCKSKRRKCNEAKPICGRCQDRGEYCEWGPRLIFRNQNALGVATDDLVPQQHGSRNRKPVRFKIKDVTSEVIRDYHHTDHIGDVSDETDEPGNAAPSSRQNEPATHVQRSPIWQNPELIESATPSFDGVQHHAPDQSPTQPEPTSIPMTLPPTGNLHFFWDSPNATWNFDDNVFLPDSAYLDAHSTLRSHLMYEVRSTGNTRQTTPDPYAQEANMSPVIEPGQESRHTSDVSIIVEEPPPEGLTFLQSSTQTLSDEEEFALWKNWVDEIAPWLDKFDSQRHFQHVLPIMARSHDYLRYSILAVSARQIERQRQSEHTERSLSLYQNAIQLVLPELHTRSTPVIATCVVLCVLEMLSSSAKAWRQHLDGCAHLLEAVGINGFSGGINQALFWCFARMDVCGGLIASEKTLIPIAHWSGGVGHETQARKIEAIGDFNAHACQAVYLCAQVLDLLSHHPRLAERVGAPDSTNDSSEEYASRWRTLWSSIQDWYTTRPAEMLPILSANLTTKPFPMVLYSNPAAISGNQLYHTASILMLHRKPSHVILKPRPTSIFWHARQVCAISTSNHHHGARLNSIQPLWIAGQWMSHESEQEAILDLYEMIEKETGWGTKWRAEDLKEFWARRSSLNI